MKTYYTSTTKVTDDGLLTRWLTDEEGYRVCKAEFMLDHNGDAVVVQLDTPKAYRGNGYARKLLSEMGKRETTGYLLVIANANASSFMKCLVTRKSPLISIEHDQKHRTLQVLVRVRS